MKVMVMDVEGMDEGGDNGQVILISLLLSSYMIYNTMGYITEEAIRGLGVILGFAQDLEGANDLNLPFFHWIIRDFTLELSDTLGYPITEKQYLERSL